MERLFEFNKPGKGAVEQALYGEDTYPDWDKSVLDRASSTLIREVRMEKRIRDLLDCPQLFRDEYEK